MSKTLEAFDISLGKLLNGEYQFRIPIYQRPYAWTTDQAGDLFDDLVSAMQEKSGNNDVGSYFLGSIVIIKNSSSTKADVVDGQQRLTTLTILLAALREQMPDAANDITGLIYKIGKHSLGEPDEYHLIIRDQDADFFRINVQERGGIEKLVSSTNCMTDSRLRLRENAALLLARVKGMSDEDRKALWILLATGCSLVVISTPDIDAAYRIFSVLNNRGLDLAPIDILKAEVLGLVETAGGSDQSNAYAGKWDQIESMLGREDFGHLLSHLRAIYAKQKPRTTLLRELKEYIPEYREKYPKALIDEVLRPYAEVWDFVRDADFNATQLADVVNEHLSWLNRIDFKDWVPPALAYCKRFCQQPQKLAGFLKQLERLTWFLAVTRANINERIRTYARLTQEIEQDNNSILQTLDLNAQQKEEFVRALDGDVYRNLPKVRMALVLRLEARLSDGSKQQTFKHLSLEHVLPQSPGENSVWIKWFPQDNEREAWVHRLANLVPLHTRKNSAAGNLDFDRKKNEYFTANGLASPFVLTQEVRSFTEWNSEILKTRQKRLIGIFEDLFELSWK